MEVNRETYKFLEETYRSIGRHLEKAYDYARKAQNIENNPGMYESTDKYMQEFARATKESAKNLLAARNMANNAGITTLVTGYIDLDNVDSCRETAYALLEMTADKKKAAAIE